MKNSRINNPVHHEHELFVRTQNEMPHIVCLCGSTKFQQEFMDANYRETMKGNIVLSVGFFMHAQNNRHGQDVGATEEQKAKLDDLHLRKIDLCDEVLILNVPSDDPPMRHTGYIGRSTRREAWYARRMAKPIRFLNTITNVSYEPIRGEDLDKLVDSWFANWKDWMDAAQEAAKVTQSA